MGVRGILQVDFHKWDNYNYSAIAIYKQGRYNYEEETKLICSLLLK